MPLGGLVVGGVTSILGGILGSSAASKAAAAQAAAAKAAAAGVTAATTAGQADITAGQGAADTAISSGAQQAQGAIASGTQQAQQQIGSAGQQQASLYSSMVNPLQSYQTAGTVGLDSLQSSAGTFAAPTAAQAAATPGYQFQLQQGLKALNSSAATSGILQSGANQKANLSYAEGLASTTYQNTYNNALSTYNANQQGYQTLANLGATANSQNLSAGSTYGGQITSLANLGSNASMTGGTALANTAMTGGAELGTTALQGNEAAAAMGMQGATTEGGYLTNAGNAQAAGTVGAANAWSGALSGVAGAVTGMSNLGVFNGTNGQVTQGGSTNAPVTLPYSPGGPVVTPTP